MTDAGLRSAYIGKWHLDGGDYFGRGECPDGFDPDWWYDEKKYLEELPERDRKKSRRIQTALDPAFPEVKTFGYRVASRAVDFLENHGGDDFFLTVSFDEPHDPFICPPRYTTPFMVPPYKLPSTAKEDLSSKPLVQSLWNLVEGAGLARLQAPVFFGCNSFADAQIGRVLAALDRIAPDALIVYTSDHGDCLGAHGLMSKGPAMYNEITNIPLIIRQNGHIAPGTVTDSLASHVDLLPTLLTAAGAEIPDTLEGRSLLPVLRNPEAEVNGEIFMEFGRYEIDHDGFGGFQPIRCVFDGRYKLSVNLLDRDEFYDLKRDPKEKHNRIDSQDPELQNHRNRLHDRLLMWMNDTRDPFRGYQWQVRPWRTDGPSPSYSNDGMTRSRPAEPDEDGPLDYATGLEVRELVRKK